VAFGRTGEENFTKSLSRSAKQQAVRQALSMKNADKVVFVLPAEAKLTGKTKDAVKILKDMKLQFMLLMQKKSIRKQISIYRL
jgi:ribosomal protein L4